MHYNLYYLLYVLIGVNFWLFGYSFENQLVRKINLVTGNVTL